VILSFADESTADIYFGRDTKVARRIPKPLWPVVRRKLDAVNRARILPDLRLVSGNRLEELKGQRSGEFSVRVNDQYRITFRFKDGDAHEVCCEDYH